MSCTSLVPTFSHSVPQNFAMLRIQVKRGIAIERCDIKPCRLRDARGLLFKVRILDRYRASRYRLGRYDHAIVVGIDDLRTGFSTRSWHVVWIRLQCRKRGVRAIAIWTLISLTVINWRVNRKIGRNWDIITERSVRATIPPSRAAPGSKRKLCLARHRQSHG